MTGRELSDKMLYMGMERALRRLAIKDKLAPLEKIACMTEIEICDLAVKNYEVVFTEDENIGLVKPEDMDTYKKIVHVLAR